LLKKLKKVFSVNIKHVKIAAWFGGRYKESGKKKRSWALSVGLAGSIAYTLKASINYHIWTYNP